MRLLDHIKQLGPNDANAVSVVGLREHIKQREDFRSQYSYAVPTDGAITRIKTFIAGDCVLEVGAGRGLWAKLLSDADVAIEATDVCRPEQSPYEPLTRSSDMFFGVKIKDAELAVLTTKVNCLLLVWPPNSAMAWTALRRFSGNKVVYIGDPNGNVTADHLFVDLLRNSFELVDQIEIPQWVASPDVVLCYCRKQPLK